MEEPSRDLNRRERWPEKEIDKALLARYRQDESAFNAIYERFTPIAPLIESHLRRLTRRRGGHLARHLPGAMPETQRTATGHEAGAFLHTIAERRLTDCIRRRRQRNGITAQPSTPTIGTSLTVHKSTTAA